MGESSIPESTLCNEKNKGKETVNPEKDPRTFSTSDTHD